MNKNLLKTYRWLFLLLFLGIFYAGIPWFALAQEEASESSQIDQETVRDNLKKRLEDSLTDKLEKVKGVLQEDTKFYAYVGEVTKIEDQILALKRQDQEKKVAFDEDTTLVFSPKKDKSKNIDSKEIESGWQAIAMGKVDQDKVLQAQRIVFSEESPIIEIERKVIFGKIAEIDNQKITLKNHEELSLTVDKKTKLAISGVKEPELTDVNVDDKAVVVLQKDDPDEETYTLKALFVWPGSASPEAKDNQVNATDSAKNAEE